MSLLKNFVFAVIATIVFSTAGWSACEGDLNCSGATDGADLAIFAADFGTGSGCANCDDVAAEIQALRDRVEVLEATIAEILSRIE